MARRKDHTREQLTDLAVKAGRQLVAEQGPTALTARNIAQAIGYTPGTLYNVFENIDALAAAINIESMLAFAEKIRRPSTQSQTTEDRIRHIALAYLEFHKDEPQLWSLLFAVPLDHHSDAYHAAIHAIFDQVTEAMQPLSETPTLARRKAKILWATLHGICLLQQSSKLDVSEEDSAEELVDQFLNQFLET